MCAGQLCEAPTCPNTAVIHSPAEDNSSPALAAPVHLGDEGFPLGQKGVYDFESVYPDGSQEATTVVVEATPTSKCCKCGRAIASTGCKEFDSNDNNRPGDSTKGRQGLQNCNNRGNIGSVL